MAARKPTQSTRKTPARTASKPAGKTAAKPAAKPVAKSAAKPAAEPAPRRLGLFSALAVGVVAAGSLAAWFGRRLFARGEPGHAAPDLALDRPHPGPDDRAPDAFRPDPTAPVPASEREALRPALVASR
jgi:hypothetical protein